MSNPSTFSVRLHVSHPRRKAADITRLFDLKPQYTRSFGGPRVTKLGENLGGTYSQTDISFLITERPISNDETLLTEFIDAQLKRLPLDAIDELVSSGGMCFFFVGVYSDGNILCDFDSDLLRRLARHGIGLKLDFYGGPEITDTNALPSPSEQA